MQSTLIICVKNEEKSLVDVIDQAKKFVNKILVIDGCSTDNSANLAKGCEIDVLTDNGKGKGAAIKMGVRNVDGDEIIVFMDADGSHEAEDIQKLIKPIENGEADMVIASRWMGGSDEFSGSLENLVRFWGNRIITKIINWRFKSNLTDTQNGFRAINSDVAKKLYLKSDNFSIEQEMVMKTLMLGYKIQEIPSHEYKRRFGKSKVNLFYESPNYLWGLLKNII